MAFFSIMLAMISLDALAQSLDGSKLLHCDAKAAKDIQISGLDCDSRVAATGHIFVCKGQAFKLDFLKSALAAGCVAYMCDETHSKEAANLFPDVPQLLVEDIRLAMSVASPLCWGNPTADKSVFALGITGTKGKSTTAYMLRDILLEAGHTSGIMGSIDTDDGIEHFESINTTPEAPDLWRHFANCKASNTKFMVMEVSSHALKYQRVEGVQLEVAAFLNIGEDHISPVEHPNFEDYFASKLKIFKQAKCAVINLDSDNVDRILRESNGCERRLVYTLDDDVAEGYFGYCGEVKDICLWADNIRPTETGMSFCVHTPSWTDQFEIAMLGRFNVENAMCAITVAYSQGISKEDMQKALAKTQVPGRMKLLTSGNPKVSCVVDYAHNAMSFESFFQSMREHYGSKKLIAVFGAPGNKAYERRRDLPQIAAKYADLLIFTEDDPTREKLEDILAEMVKNTPEGCDYKIIPDRNEAIFEATRLAYSEAEGAVVCLLAKGDDNYQHRKEGFVPKKLDGDLFREAAQQINALKE